jgi:uncharacterized protein YabN with tetrapyrrole methylase and pyrophosphatase domain
VSVTILGLGITGLEHVTAQADAALRAADEVLFVDAGVASEAFLRARCPVVVDLYAESYAQGEPRLDAYAHMAARVLERGLEADVAFALFGHPTLFSYAPFLVRDLGGLLGVEVRVLPGVSSMDCLFAELMLDPAVAGLQLYEATDLLLRRRPLQADVPALIWQVGNLETRLHSQRTSRPERFARFLAHLLRFYPPDHEAVAYYASPHPLVGSVVRRFPLRDLPAQAEALHAGVTLYLPAVRVRPIEDPELLAALDDPEHLRRLTR